MEVAGTVQLNVRLREDVRDALYAHITAEGRSASRPGVVVEEILVAFLAGQGLLDPASLGPRPKPGKPFRRKRETPLSMALDNLASARARTDPTRDTGIAFWEARVRELGGTEAELT